MSINSTRDNSRKGGVKRKDMSLLSAESDVLIHVWNGAGKSSVADLLLLQVRPGTCRESLVLTLGITITFFRH